MLSHLLSVTLKKVLPGLSCLLPALSAFSQVLSVGSTDVLFIANGTTFSADSLILIPLANLSISSNTLFKNTSPIGSTTPGVTSITRVYNLSAPITYSGTLGLIYQDAELGANTESLLQIAYSPAAAGPWTTTLGGTVNTSTNYVNNTFTSTPVLNVTATTSGIILPITHLDFSAQLNDQFVLVSWKVASTTPLVGFNIETSTDGRNWKTTAYMPAVQDEEAYSFKDPDLNFTIRYYRVVITDASGQTDYTSIVSVRRPTAAVVLQIVSSGGDRIINFTNATPDDGIQLYDFNGRLLKKMDLSQSSYNIGSVPSGIYILRFKVATEENVRKIFLP
jgi:hypothetical protein